MVPSTCIDGSKAHPIDLREAVEEMRKNEFK